VGVNGEPSGFLLAMVTEGASNHLIPWAITTSGNGKKLQDDYILASVVNTPNGGSFNHVENKAQFVGQALTMTGEPNPTMNFLLSIDADGEYSSTRLISFGGLVYGARITDSGQVYGMEQATANQDARLGTIDENGRCMNLYNTTSRGGFNAGHMAIDSSTSRFFVSVKNSTGAISLHTIDVKSGEIWSIVDLPNPGSTRITMCWDSVTHALYSLERLSGAVNTNLYRVDPRTAQYINVVSISGLANVGDCSGGFFYATGTVNGKTFLAAIDLSSGQMRQTEDIAVNPAPVTLIFFPQ